MTTGRINQVADIPAPFTARPEDKSPGKAFKCITLQPTACRQIQIDDYRERAKRPKSLTTLLPSAFVFLDEFPRDQNTMQGTLAGYARASQIVQVDHAGSSAEGSTKRALPAAGLCRFYLHSHMVHFKRVTVQTPCTPQNRNRQPQRRGRRKQSLSSDNFTTACSWIHIRATRLTTGPTASEHGRATQAACPPSAGPERSSLEKNEQKTKQTMPTQPTQ